MTTLRELIEQQQGEVDEVLLQVRQLSSQTVLDIDLRPIWEHTTQTATLAYEAGKERAMRTKYVKNKVKEAYESAFILAMVLLAITHIL